MAENAQTLTRQESADRAGDGPGRQEQGRVTDAEGEQSVLALALRAGQTGTGDGTRENMAQPGSVRRTARKRIGASSEGMSPAGLTRQCSINEAKGNGAKPRLQHVGDDPGKPRFQRRFHKPIPRRRACSSS